jgi:hypothetical protein
LATAANAFDHSVKRRVLAIDWIVRITHRVLLRGHLIGPQLAVAERCPPARARRCWQGRRVAAGCASEPWLVLWQPRRIRDFASSLSGLEYRRPWSF